MYETKEVRDLVKTEKSIDIAVPAEQVWPMLLWDRLPEWLDVITAAEYTSPEKELVGATAHVIGETAGVRAEWDIEITEYDKPRKATWRTTGGNLTAIGVTTLAPTETGTRLSFMIDSELPYSILGKIIDKLVVSRSFERSIERGLAKLKTMLET